MLGFLVIVRTVEHNHMLSQIKLARLIFFLNIVGLSFELKIVNT